jgi:hypothetical protein
MSYTNNSLPGLPEPGNLPPPYSETITAADVSLLNRSAIERTASIARMIANAVIAIGLLSTFAWGWTAVRTQQQYGGFDDESGVAVLDRLDRLMVTIGLLAFAGLCVGLGVAIRLAADYAVTRTGGSITGVVEGDTFAELEVSLQ